MTLSRVVSAEALDVLDKDDSTAQRSRRDLRRVHRVMGTRSILVRALRDLMANRDGNASLRLLELGAGDGSLMLSVARAVAPGWPPVELTLLDQRALLSSSTVKGYSDVGWTAIEKVTDVRKWATCALNSSPKAEGTQHWDLIVVNLFLHHFEHTELALLMHAMAKACDRCLACEPRRAMLALAGSHLIGAIGAGAVTRDDAVKSVHAGFANCELTALWPVDGDDTRWEVREYSAGLFSHCFSAQRTGGVVAITV